MAAANAVSTIRHCKRLVTEAVGFRSMREDQGQCHARHPPNLTRGIAVMSFMARSTAGGPEQNQALSSRY